ncbi:hypothetical protein FIBSPDRAFT_957202 [Athelia psychrophila]|uniref:Histidine kinase n=1 Tax=Athelia psychrophila TaxID=1759441 RepID=A0A166G1P5_9AGAM|nr:hypothetical protein FIBSPDRAFT_957202 [Fibularhizoctonia sp. CBS 109695]
MSFPRQDNINFSHLDVFLTEERHYDGWVLGNDDRIPARTCTLWTLILAYLKRRLGLDLGLQPRESTGGRWGVDLVAKYCVPSPDRALLHPRVKPSVAGNMVGQDAPERMLHPTLAPELVFLSYCISWLGAYTAIQLHIHASLSSDQRMYWFWRSLSSIAFGFCAVWSMHFLGMLACKFDVRIAFNAPLTILSALFAVLFTFAASLSSEHWRLEYLRRCTRWAVDSVAQTWRGRSSYGAYQPLVGLPRGQDTLLLEPDSARESPCISRAVSLSSSAPTDGGLDSPDSPDAAEYNSNGCASALRPPHLDLEPGWTPWLARQRAQLTAAHLLRAGALAAAIDTMFYLAMAAMEIHEGRIEWHWARGAAAYAGTLALCTGAGLAMAGMELHVGRQMLVATLSAASVCSMHYFGMEATTMWTRAPSEPGTGFPAYLTWTIIGSSLLVCIAANALLANRAVCARRRMAETLRAKRSLWRVIAEKEAAERAHELKQRFISIASHEATLCPMHCALCTIRTPLHTVSGYAELLACTVLSGEQRMFLSHIQQACHTVNLITENVLDFSKLERDNSESAAHPVVVEPRKLLDGIARQAAAAESRPDHHTADTIICVSPRVPAALLLDETYTMRVLMNLYSNAAKFTERGFVSLVLDMDSDGRHLVVTVRDTGIGIPHGLREAIFEPFRQADSSLTRAHYGAGLGLSIVKHLVHRMDGTIAVDSVLGGGSTFTVRLPTQAAEPPAAPAAHPQAHLPQPPHPHLPHPHLPHPHPPHLPQLPSAGKRRMKVVCADPRAERLYVELWKQFGCEAQVASPRTSAEEFCRDADILWADATSMRASEGLARLAATLGAEVHSDNTDNTDKTDRTAARRPLLCIVYSVAEDLLALGAGVKAERVYLVRQPVVMHAVLAFLDAAYLQAESELRAPVGDATVTSPVTPARASPRASSRAPQPGHQTRTPMAKVLLVEDNLVRNDIDELHRLFCASSTHRCAEQINQRLGKRLVEKLGYEVNTANNGQEAVQIASQGGYGICLMDLQMPIMDGFAATTRIRELERNGTFRGRMWIIALSANVTHESAEKGRAAGMDHFLPKPLRLDALQTALEQA